MNFSKAIRFVKAKGTTLERYRLHFLLNKEKKDEIPLQHLRNLQNKDGGFPYNDEKGKANCVNATSNNLDLIIELELAKSEVGRKTVEYLLNIQGTDGSWNENEAIKPYNPPFWDLPNDHNTTMWLTANITNLLLQLGYRKMPPVQQAAKFLLRNYDNQGKFTGFLHSTWISIGVFGQLEGKNSGTVKKAVKVIENNIERLKNGGGDFAWCLECLYVAGIPKENPLVKKCIQKLISLQREDGTWVSGDAERLTVSTTINALKVLKKYSIW